MTGSEHIRSRDDAPLIWTDFETLQFGVDRPLAIFESPSPQIQRLIAMVQRGTRIDALGAAALDEGLSSAELQRLLLDLKPALREVAPAPSVQSADNGYQDSDRRADGPQGRRTVLLTDPNAGANPPLLHRTLRLLGYDVVPTDTGSITPSKHPVISVERYFADTHALAFWRAQSIPVLPVQFSDRSIHVGPWLHDNGPCGNCVNLRRARNNPSWRSAATQLIGRKAPTEFTPAATIAAALVSQLVKPNISAGQRPCLPSAQYRITLGADDGVTLTTTNLIGADPDCRHHGTLESSLA